LIVDDADDAQVYVDVTFSRERPRQTSVICANNRSTERRCPSCTIEGHRPVLLLFIYLWIVLTLVALVAFYVGVAVTSAGQLDGDEQSPTAETAVTVATTAVTSVTVAVAVEDSVVATSETLVGCDEIRVDDVWVAGLPKLMTESAVRLLDVNRDGVEDVLIGFATGRYA